MGFKLLLRINIPPVFKTKKSPSENLSEGDKTHFISLLKSAVTLGITRLSSVASQPFQHAAYATIKIYFRKLEYLLVS